jgi:hypothetical protein
MAVDRKSEVLLAAPPSGGPARLSDAEVICSWMEPRPTSLRGWWRSSAGRWWIRRKRGTVPHNRVNTLDALWEVQERLTSEQWRLYRREFRLAVEREDGTFPLGERVHDYLHATPKQKIEALAAVLRPIVEASLRVARGPDGTRASNSSASPSALSPSSVDHPREKYDLANRGLS